MTNEHIKEKYGIEPIMKEMWVWDDGQGDAELLLVLVKTKSSNLPFICIKDGLRVNFQNACETNPKDKEPKVGDKGYFWTKYMEENNTYMYGELMQVPTNQNYEYCNTTGNYFTYFSHEKQPWMQ